VVVRKSVNQIIVVGEKLNVVYPLFETDNVLLISSGSFEDVRKGSVFGVELSCSVVYDSNNKETALKHIV